MVCDLPDLPLESLLIIFQYTGNVKDILVLASVSRMWRNIFDKNDRTLWRRTAEIFRLELPIGSDHRSLRSKSDYKRSFCTAVIKKRELVKYRHDLLIVHAKNLLQATRDPPISLHKLILKWFPDLVGFNIDWHGTLVEQNTLVTLAARSCHPKTIKYLVEKLGAKIDTADVGGFTPLIMSAYRGNLAAVKACLNLGADIYCSGRLRSGAPMSAEHWAAVKGHKEIFELLRTIRKKLEQKSIATAAIQSTASTDESRSSLADTVSQTHVQQSSVETFCICTRGFIGCMVACDNPSCVVEWFHLECVGLKTAVRLMIFYSLSFCNSTLYFVFSRKVPGYVPLVEEIDSLSQL